MPKTRVLYPTALSGTNDGTTFTANGATMVLGYSVNSVANGVQANLRFDTHLVGCVYDGTDLASVSPWTTVTSASYQFQTTDIGSTLYIQTAGTNFTVGKYTITAVSANGAATLNAACGSTGAASGATWFLGPFNTQHVVATQFLSTVTAVGASGTPHTTDLTAATATTTPVVSSISYTFLATDVGKTITITAGTNWLTGTYTIVSVAGGNATLNKACGSSATLTAGTWYEGTLAGANHPFALWGANYRSALGIGEYNVSANNLQTEYRQQITPTTLPLIPSFTTATFAAAGGSPYAAVYVVPSRFLNAGVPGDANIFPATFAGVDLASSNGTNAAPSVTSASHTFTQSDVGQPLNILAGTNWTTGIFTIVSVAGGAATLDRACGSSASISAGIWYEGGTCDLEIRLLASGTVTQTGDTVTVQGPASVGTYASGIYSGQTEKPTLTVVSISPTEMSSGQSPYRKVAIGAESYFAYDIEPVEGYAVVGQNILDVDSIGLTQQAANLFGAALSNERARPRKVAIGRTGSGGNISFELTPEKWTKLLTGLMKIVSILDSNGNELGNATIFNGPVSGTDLTSTNATSLNPVVTSASRNFGITDLDQTIVVTAGTNWTTGTYTVVGVFGAGAAGAPLNGAVLNKACGSAASISGGTWVESGPAPTTANTTIALATVTSNITTFSSTGPYTYQFRTCQSSQVNSFTGIVKKGSFRKVYPGLKVSSMSFSVGLDNLVRATVDFAGLDEFTYDQTSFGLSGDEIVLSTSAGYDTITNSVWSYVDGVCALGSMTDSYTQATTINLSNDLRERRGLNGKRGPVSHYAQGFSASTNLTLYSETEQHLRKFLGVQYQGFPFKPGKVINFDAYSLTFGRQDISDLLQFYMPKTMFVTLADPIQGEDVIMLSGDMIGIYDYQNWNSNIVVTLTTSEVPSAFFPSTNYITVYPPDTTGIQTQGNLNYLPVNPTSPIIDPYAPGGAGGGGAGSGSSGTAGGGSGIGPSG